MKKLLLLCALALPMALLAQDADKTLVKTIQPGDAAVVEVAFKHKSMVAEAWTNEDMRITLEIHANMPEAVMEQLVKAGRYTLSTQTEGDVLKINAANLDKAVTVKGVDLQEEIHLVLNTPSNFVREGNKLMRDMRMIEALVQATGGRTGKSEMAQLRKIGKAIQVDYKIVSKVTPEQFDQMVAEKEMRGLTPSKTKEEAPVSSGAPQARKSGGSLKDLNIKRGDILIGGQPMEIE